MTAQTPAEQAAETWRKASEVLAQALPDALGWDWEEGPGVPSVEQCAAGPALLLATALADAGLLAAPAQPEGDES